MKIVEMLRMVLASIFLCLFVIGVSPALTEARVVQENYSLADIHRVSISDLQDLFYRVEIQKEIDIDFQNHLLEEALRYIAGEANLRLTYRGDIIKDWSVTIDREQISVSDALDQILAGTGLEYMVSQDGYLLISQIPVDTEQPVIQETVQGEVIDSETGELLPGVSIQIQGTAIGTPTNADGTYSLLVSSLNDTLIFSYLGYERTVVPIAGRTVIDVALNPVSIEGDEVVVVGYGTASQRNITGSVSSVRSDQLSTIARSSINQMLQGRVPGLNMATRGAQPGSGVTVNIRGAISSGNNTPLYVIDGVPMTSFNSTVPGLETGDLGFYGGIDRDPLSHLNPSDIESITVLKDASAAAIYGSAAANGVILVTTRGGRAGDLQVEYEAVIVFRHPRTISLF